MLVLLDTLARSLRRLGTSLLAWMLSAEEKLRKKTTSWSESMVMSGFVAGIRGLMKLIKRALR